MASSFSIVVRSGTATTLDRRSAESAGGGSAGSHVDAGLAQGHGNVVDQRAQPAAAPVEPLLPLRAHLVVVRASAVAHGEPAAVAAPVDELLVAVDDLAVPAAGLDPGEG